MKKSLVLSAMLGGLAFADPAVAYDNLWVHAATGALSDNKGLLLTSNVIVHASRVGMKEILLPGLDTCWIFSPARRAQFLEVKRIADANGIGIVPLIWSTGYGTMCGVDPGLIESVPVTNLHYVAKGGLLVPNVNQTEIIRNGGFESPGKRQNTFEGWGVDHPGSEAFVDTQTYHSGGSAIRMEPGPGKDTHDHARLNQRVALTPGRKYRVTAWFKAEDLDVGSGYLGLMVNMVKAPDGTRTTAGRRITGLTNAEGWRKVTVDFFTGASDGAYIWCGTWGAKSGRFWVDDVSLQEIGLREIARRADSPRTVRSTSTGKVYEFGKDWQNPNWKRHRTDTEITFPVPKGSAIREGEEVLLDTYIPNRSGQKLQISTCMSDPHLYELFHKSAEALEELLHPKKWFLSLDEVRNGGTCPLCAARNTDMAHILAGCVVRQCEIIRSVRPDAEIYTWSDMFDPNHNAKGGQYYGCKGTFVGIWDLIPRDIIIVLWYGGVLDKSVPFFSEHGFRLMGSVCCDGKTVDHVGKWKAALDAVPGSKGFMYTTWRKDYGQLDDFAKTILGK